jgi:hypothetical protein
MRFGTTGPPVGRLSLARREDRAGLARRHHHGRGAPGESLTKMKALSAKEKNAKKAQRKREKDARKKNRR